MAISLRTRSKAAISRARTLVSGMRRSGHWLERIANSNWALPVPLSDVLHQVSREEPLEIHYTPKHGSWLNMAEIELAVLSAQCLDRRLPDSETLAQEVAAWEEDRNQTATAVNWRFTTAAARIKLKHLYPSHEQASFTATQTRTSM